MHLLVKGQGRRYAATPPPPERTEVSFEEDVANTKHYHDREVPKAAKELCACGDEQQQIPALLVGRRGLESHQRSRDSRDVENHGLGNVRNGCVVLDAVQKEAALHNSTGLNSKRRVQSFGFGCAVFGPRGTGVGRRGNNRSPPKQPLGTLLHISRPLAIRSPDILVQLPSPLAPHEAGQQHPDDRGGNVAAPTHLRKVVREPEAKPLCGQLAQAAPRGRRPEVLPRREVLEVRGRRRGGRDVAQGSRVSLLRIGVVEFGRLLKLGGVKRRVQRGVHALLGYGPNIELDL
mmetsp:Transcript_123862/g.396511  ORF Transcript_123862/g.396511 Transcript_123862/m.396511 type:complete len:290 (-) Transcript_123862:1549-2418(-)